MNPDETERPEIELILEAHRHKIGRLAGEAASALHRKGIGVIISHDELSEILRPFLERASE